MRLSTVATLLVTLPTLTALAQNAPMAMPAKPPVKPSAGIIVTTNSTDVPLVPRTFTIAMLKALPQQTITAVDGHTGRSSTYTGPLVSDVFGAFGFNADETTHPFIMRGLVIAEGTDGYRAVYSMTELEPSFSSGKVIVALTQDGKPVASGIQLVNTTDVKPARWVHGLLILAFSTVPPYHP